MYDIVISIHWPSLSLNTHIVKNILFYVIEYLAIGLMSRVFANGPGDLGSIPGRVIPKTQEMLLDSALLNTQVRIKSKVKQGME